MKNLLIYILFVLLASCATHKDVQKSNYEALSVDSVSLGQSATLRQVKSPIGLYTVQEGDTLMWISFLVYGDYEKWREIKEINPQIEGTEIIAGEILKFNEPEEKFIWQKVGNPYLIQRGDTLGKISIKHYYTPSRWKEIYENNLQMIKNPDLIFAGFTLYTPLKTDMAYLKKLRDRVYYKRNF